MQNSSERLNSIQSSDILVVKGEGTNPDRFFCNLDFALNHNMITKEGFAEDLKEDKIETKITPQGGMYFRYRSSENS